MNDLEQILDDCLEQMASGTSSLEGCLIRHSQEAAELEPLLRAAAGLGYGREASPSPAFRARSRAELVRYMQAHPRGGTPAARAPLTTGWPFWRITLSLALLLVFLLASGTAYAQRAIPGDAFYGWKLISEGAWRALSRDRVGTDLVIAGRRMNEYLSVVNDPGRSQTALRGYGEVLVRLRSETDNQTRGRIVPVLENHAQSLKDTGLFIPQLDDIIQEQAGAITSPASAPGAPGMNDATHGPGAGNAHRQQPDNPNQPDRP